MSVADYNDELVWEILWKRSMTLDTQPNTVFSPSNYRSEKFSRRSLLQCADDLIQEGYTDGFPSTVTSSTDMSANHPIITNLTQKGKDLLDRLISKLGKSRSY